MTNRKNNLPTHLFEVSWEVCNKVGGIHTVVATKSPTVKSLMEDNYIVIGPDFNREDNVEFVEDPSLFKEWKKIAYNDGIRVLIGRWKIESSPIAFLVDFSSYVSRKDDILGKLWVDYKVDSLKGSWDYVEPVLFGYAAARAIESFINYYEDKDNGHTVAHFHEWMTGSGVLYLKKYMPQIAAVFTTHATVMGRCIAGNGLSLYSDMDKFNVDELAARFNVTSKYSLEVAAADSADCFTTVSQITSNECCYMVKKEADCITPNGFDDVIVWKDIETKRKEAKDSLITIAEASLGKKFKTDPLIVGTSGRYEFKNKGLDEFIDALALLNEDSSVERDILAYILVPGWNYGPRKDLQEYLKTGVWEGDPYAIKNVTHYIGDSLNDAILGRMRNSSLENSTNGNVSIMFVPAYLNGFDGIFNKHYYELLPGFDVTAFPSYYEPWGYTPLESIAFSVPSITTTLSGFGKWVETHSKNHEAVVVIERNDGNQSEVKYEIADVIREYVIKTKEEINKIRESAKELSKQSLWHNLFDNYLNAYKQAMGKATERSLQLSGGENHEQINFLRQQLSHSSPNWRRVMIERTMPDRLRPLDELAHNLWWSWTLGARQLFESIDADLWNNVERNPIAMLDNLKGERLREIEQDVIFLEKMDKVYAEFKEYMSKKEKRGGNKIAYFSMEYGLHSSLKIYSGGLGILAGDYLKEASDKNINMVAIGLLYRYGYFTQKLSIHGEQEATYEAQNFYKLPINPLRDKDGKWVVISLQYPGRTVSARIWRCDVGRTELYLLDTDHTDNMYEDQSITHHLYGGDWENRLKQEILLGLGGIKALNAIGVEADVYHCNEGHAAFIGMRRTHDLIEQKHLSFSEALEVVRSSSLFTTHTPVPAGHDSFPEDMIRQYFSSTHEQLKITWEQFINLGKTRPNDPFERFSMSVLASNMSQEVNGVSWLHGEVSKEILGNMWPGYFKEELHIGYVTNGVHAPTWTASNLREIYNQCMGAELETHNYDKSIWQRIYDVPDETLWDARMFLKKKLINHVIKRTLDPSKARYDSPTHMVKIAETIRPETLTIGFARRFATYKRAHLLFSNLERLEKIVNNAERPVQFLFAGKAHPNDKPGQDLIKRIVEVSKLPQFVGKILFLQNYDMELARRMVQGVDVWMNTPTRPLEASGTSGEKAVMNGVLHFSVLDGWWVEGYKEGAGWMLPMERHFEEQQLQDELDAELIYAIIEEEIVPAYYDKETKEGCSKRWMGFVKKCIADVASEFTTVRMIEDYQERFYTPLALRNSKMRKNNFEEAREIASWKRKISRYWDEISIIETKTYDITQGTLMTGSPYKSTVKVGLGELSTNDIGVEIVIAQPNDIGDGVKLINTIPLSLVSLDDKVATYECDLMPDLTGSFDIAVRVFASNPKLAHRMDFALVKWN